MLYKMTFIVINELPLLGHNIFPPEIDFYFHIHIYITYENSVA